MSLLNLLPDPCNRAINDDGKVPHAITLTERLAEIDGVEVRNDLYTKTIDNGEIEYSVHRNCVWITSDTFIGDSHVISEPLSEDTIVELFSKW